MSAYPVAQWQALRAAGVTLRTIGDQWGVSAQTVSDWCSGRRWHTIGRYQRAFGAGHCQCCGIVLAESVDARYPAEPVGNYCGNCRELYPERCVQEAT